MSNMSNISNVKPFSLAMFKKKQKYDIDNDINNDFDIVNMDKSSSSNIKKRNRVYDRKWNQQHGSKLVWLPLVIMKMVITYMDHTSYLYMTSTCIELQMLHNDETINANYILDYVYIMKLIFDQQRNVFITGSGGCGKTWIMNKIYEKAKRINNRVAVTATTGIASTNLTDGRTIHSFSGLRKGTIPVDKLEESLANGKIRPPLVWRDTDLLLIDEISMNGSRFLQKLDLVARYRRENNLPFGGLQLAVSGDFLQLKPVADSFPFTSDIWKGLNFKTVHLKYPFRQSGDLKYYKLLQRIRKGEANENDIKFLKEKYEETMANMDEIMKRDIKPTRFKSRQKDVKKINDDEFNSLKSPIEHTFMAENRVMRRYESGGKYIYEPTFDISLDAALAQLKGRAEHQAPTEIRFRDGAQYMLTFNFSVAKKHVNGSRCVYRSGGTLEFMDGSTMTLDKVEHEFSYNIGNNLYVFRKQKALRLAYASTIHSAQGLTVDCAMVDLGPTVFDYGQAYVALSRVRSADGLYIDNFQEKSLKTNKLAKEYMNKIEII